MKVEFKKSFIRDLKKLKNKSLYQRLAEKIEQVEQTDSLLSVTSLEKMKGVDDYYRIRIGNYRVGLKLNNDTVLFVRFLHRKEIYRYFP